ncbi:gamma-glutamyltransferase [Pontixanthobacter aestiaquae]|uniref:Glutathione hydrolase proenzyme n=1 Tax=Pontixanthobacter aestiaquae TaxID=1509367 RepID=A0A844Z3T0_9SPHN|nr:gamma-glutamyltransferase [Pontixanthobacter aestiaquae]MDN3646854.1 gamma-glutamyltransferase [Pontixanthobacter aestiaquae]MXO82164.1 gamma-glutamyltransferase [Pontixanthobacter aestiaquae]
MTYRLIAALSAPLLIAGCAAPMAEDLSVNSIPEATLAVAGSVSAADPRAQAAGEEMLAAGGSATDAAIAVMLALTVVEPQSSGIGGGGFYVRGTADGRVETLDGRETAPAGADPQWFMGEDGKLLPYREALLSGLSVGVPGNVAMVAKAHERHGKLPWAKLFEPAIKLAKDGFAVNRRLHQSLDGQIGRAGLTEYGRTTYYTAEGEPKPVGTTITNPDLVFTLETLAEQGTAAFYESGYAIELANIVRLKTPRAGGMTAEDVMGYVSKEREPVCGQYRGYRVCGMGPPSSGAVAVVQILGQLERFDLAALGADNPVTWHLFLESQRLAYADREIYLADSDFVDVPVKGLIDPVYIARRSALIDPDKAIEKVTPGTPAGAPTIAWADGDEPPENGTSHFAVVDKDGTMVSYTSTIEGPFGSGLIFGGFYLNNELTDFSRSPEVDGRLVANRVEGGKRPRSSMSPTIIYSPNGKPFAAIGAAGGTTIPVQTARGIIGLIDFGLTVDEALGLPLLMAFGERVLVEEGTWFEEQMDTFKSLGHDQIIARKPPLKAGAVHWNGTEWISARDPRLDGMLEYTPE